MNTIGRPIDANGSVADCPPVDNLALPFGQQPKSGHVSGGVPDFAIHNPVTCRACRELRAEFASEGMRA